MRRVVWLALAALPALLAVAETPEALYRRAYRAESVERDLAAAVELYGQAAAGEPPLAKAFLRQGICLEALERKKEARAAYAAALAAATEDAATAQNARWRLDQLAEPVPPPEPPKKPRGKRWDISLEGGYSTLYPAHIFDRNDATYGSAGFAPHHGVFWTSAFYRLSSGLAVGLELGEFLSAEAQTEGVDAVESPGSQVALTVTNQVTYFGPALMLDFGKGAWRGGGSLGFGPSLERSRVDYTYTSGPSAGATGTARGRNSDISFSAGFFVTRRVSRDVGLGLGLHYLAVFLREYEEGRAATDPFTERVLRHLFTPTLQIRYQF